MDSLTQIVLGSVIATAGFQQALGRRAILLGAICGSLPDADVLLHNMQSWEGLKSHRGYSHSLLILPFLSIPVGGMASQLSKQWDKKSNLTSSNPASILTWIHLAFWTLITHPLLDLCTTYGTQLLLPLSDYRFSIDAIAIVDPIYTLPLLGASIFALLPKSSPQISKKVAQSSLLFTTLWLGFGYLLSQLAIHHATHLIQQHNFQPVAIRASPPIALPLLRRVVARDKNNHLVTVTFSPLLYKPSQLQHYTQPDLALLEKLLSSTEGEVFHWFADGYVGLTANKDVIRIFDARYGLYLQPWWSPFSASLDASNTLQLVPRGERPPIDFSQEINYGWSLMWNPPPSL